MGKRLFFLCTLDLAVTLPVYTHRFHGHDVLCSGAKRTNSIGRATSNKYGGLPKSEKKIDATGYYCYPTGYCNSIAHGSETNRSVILRVH